MLLLNTSSESVRLKRKSGPLTVLASPFSRELCDVPVLWSRHHAVNQVQSQPKALKNANRRLSVLFSVWEINTTQPRKPLWASLERKCSMQHVWVEKSLLVTLQHLKEEAETHLDELHTSDFSSEWLLLAWFINPSRRVTVKVEQSGEQNRHQFAFHQVLYCSGWTIVFEVSWYHFFLLSPHLRQKTRTICHISRGSD